MKNPSSAAFSDEKSSGHGEYTVTGTVRGENTFGGTEVHTYTCTATYDEKAGGYLTRATIR